MQLIVEAWDLSHLRTVLTDESGQDMAEYAVLIGLVALAVIASIMLLGESISSVFNNIDSSLTIN